MKAETELQHASLILTFRLSRNWFIFGVIFSVAISIPGQLTSARAPADLGSSHRQKQVEAAAGTNPTLTVHVYNYARVPRGQLRNAESEAARIIGGAGVETIWFDCTLSSLAPLQTQRGPRPDCSWNPGNGADATLRILNRSDYDGAALNQEIFGYAYSPLLAAVLFDRVADLADAEGYTDEASLILGDIMAHEIGHLFLDPDAHSRAGIMCSEWGDAQLQRGLMGGLMFTPDQSVRIRAAIEAKTKRSGAPHVGADANRAGPQITLRVYNHAVSHSLLHSAEGEATVIFNYTGIKAVWVDCPLSDAEIERYPACKTSIGPNEFIITILNKAETERISHYHEALGQALECPKSQDGCISYVFYRDISELASVGNAAEFRLLGHVFAHEIGHMLLGPSHSMTGMMRARWNYTDMKTIAKGFLFFTDDESQRVRDAVLARDASDQAVEVNARRSRFSLGAPGGHEPFQSGDRREQWLNARISMPPCHAERFSSPWDFLNNKATTGSNSESSFDFYL